MKKLILSLCMASVGLVGAISTAHAVNVMGTKITRVHVALNVNLGPKGGVWFSSAAPHPFCGGKPHEYYIDLNSEIGQAQYNHVQEAFKGNFDVDLYGRGECGPYGVEKIREIQMYRGAGWVSAEGKNGRDGKDGVAGKDGKAGANGVNGVNGKDGKEGKAGVNGKDGKAGVNGKDGKEGKAGVNGKDGKEGKAGVNGKDGKEGKAGVNGKDGKG